MAESLGAPVSLTCEYLVNPLGIDEPQPRLAWQVNDPRRGAVQRAYQILVASNLDILANDRADMWDSRKVMSVETVFSF